MNCPNHPEAAAVAYCRACGKPLCGECRRVSPEGVIYCAEHSPSPAMSYTPAASGAPVGGGSPVLAGMLGLIPGVGAIYNGQYAKGLVHAIIFGLLVSVLNANAAEGLEPLVGILLAAFELYMVFEAYHTARRRELGEPVDEFSSVLSPRGRRSSAGAVTLIILGAVFLLNTLGILPMYRIIRFWPVLLIALGVSMLHSRISEAESHNPPGADRNHEVNR